MRENLKDLYNYSLNQSDKKEVNLLGSDSIEVNEQGQSPKNKTMNQGNI